MGVGGGEVARGRESGGKGERHKGERGGVWDGKGEGMVLGGEGGYVVG